MGDNIGKIVAGLVLVAVIAGFVILTALGRPTEAGGLTLFGLIVQSVLPSLMPAKKDGGGSSGGAGNGSGSAKAPDGPAPPASPRLHAPLALVLLVGLLALGCGGAGAKSPEPPARAEARAVVLTLARTVYTADQACAALVTARREPALGDRCGDAYDLARGALAAAEHALDAWGSAAASDLWCALRSAAQALGQIQAMIGATTLPLVDDTLVLTRSAGAFCADGAP